jgi:DNA topoisomerase-3
VHRNGRELQPTAKAFSLMVALERSSIDESAFAGTHRPLGIQAEADGAGRAGARRVHGPHRRADPRHGRSHQARRDSRGGFQHPDQPLPEVRRRDPGELQESSSARSATTGCGRSSPAASTNRKKSTSCSPSACRPAAGLPQQDGAPFAAMIASRTTTAGVRLRPGRMATRGRNGRFSRQEALGACPKCGGRVYEHGMAYVCEKAVGAAKTCDFRSGKIILQQPEVGVPRCQAARHRPHRPAQGLHLEQDAAQVLGLPGTSRC